MRGVRTVLIAIWLVAAGAAEREDGRLLVVAHEDVPVRPWITGAAEGLDCDLVRLAAEGLGLEIRFEVMPWKRCLVMLEAGQVDAVLAASFRPERAVYARYPRTATGELDATRRLHMDAYGLYRLKGSTLDFDGQRLIDLDGRIAAQSGFSVIDQLHALGAEVDDDSKHMEPILRRLLAGRVVGAALLVASAERYIAARPEFAERVELAPVPLVSKPYFLIFSQERYVATPRLCESLWSAIAEVRESEAFVQRLQQVSDWEH